MLVASERRRGFRNSGSALLLRRLSQRANLASHEINLIKDCYRSSEEIQAGSELFAEGDRLDRVGLLVSGWACEQRVLSDGRRQIFGFLLPGDLFGAWCRSAPIAQTTVVVLKSATIADVTTVRDVVSESPQRFSGLASAFAGLQSMHEGYLLDHLVRLGRQTAYERIAHLLLELGERAAAVGLVEGGESPLPLTQEILADALGLSIVHVNRTLQQLRRDGLLDIRGSALRLRDPGRLAQIAEYQSPGVSAPVHARDWSDVSVAAQPR